jgi:amino acid transporter
MEVGPKDESCKVPNSSTTESPTIIVTGHVQELSQKFSLWSLAWTGILVGNVWPALGGSILVAIYNGGPPGVIYEFIAASCFYFVVAASLAELASAMPSSAGPYLWASVTPGKRYGPVVGFFSGYWNALAWVFAAASMSSISGMSEICSWTGMPRPRADDMDF